MSRRNTAKKREISPDYKYGDVLLSKFINCVMWEGKKFIAEKIVYGSLENLKKHGEDCLLVFKTALDNVRPNVEVKSRRVGGATYQVPVPVPVHRSYALAMRWIINFARNKNGIDMKSALSAELTDAYFNKGAAVKKRDDTLKMAEANKAFSHFRW